MKVLKIIIATLLVLSNTLLIAMAEETKDVSYKATVNFDTGDVSVEETELTGPKDFSNLQIRVLMPSEEGEAIEIFTGLLKDYDGGKWVNIDFSGIDIMTLLNWDTGEVRHIYPQKNTQMSLVPTEENNISQTDDTYATNYADTRSESLDNEFIINNVIIENTDGRVNSLQNASVLSKVILTSKESCEIIPKILAALYEDGKLINIKMIDAVGCGIEENAVEYMLNMPLTNITENIQLKIMIWDGMDTLRPLGASYNTSIVTTDYVYSKTIQTLGQEDKYIFTVPCDGYYNVEFDGSTSINASICLNDTEESDFAMSVSGQTISCPLSAEEVYMLKVSPTGTGLYSFSIKQTQIPELNNLSVGNVANGTINVPYGLEQFTFTPTTSAMYDFYVYSDEIYPVINIVGENGSEIGYEDNLTYKQDVFSSVEMNANEKYIITIKSRKDYDGSFSIKPRMINAVLNTDGTVTISGKLNSNAGKKIGMIAIDPDGSVEYLCQTVSDSNGFFNTNAKINTSISGTHSIIINSEDSEYGIICSLNGGGSTKKQGYDFWTETDADGLVATISYSSSVISALASITSTAEITNTSNKAKTITVYNILFDNSENIVEFSSVTDVVKANETRSIEKQKTMPATVVGYKWRTFVWLGKGNYNSSIRPICASKELNTSGTIMNSLPTVTEMQLTSEDFAEYSAREYTLNGQTKTLKTNELLNAIDINNQTTMLSNDEEYNGAGVEYSYKIKHNGVYYSTIMPGTNEIEFFFKNTNSTEVSFIPYVWLISISNGTLTEKYIQLGDYITLAPGEGTTTPWVHSMVLEDDYNLQLLYGDMLDLLFYMDYKGAIRFIPYDTITTPLIFNKDDGGKFIYCNNPEALSLENLSDHSQPQLLYSEKGAGIGEYTLMAEHNNQTSEPVTVDVQFFTTNYARIKITAVGVQVPLNGESWACEKAYSDYMQIDFAHNSGYSYKKFNYNEKSQTYNEEEVIYELDSSMSSVWLSDIYTRVYEKSNYPYIPEKNGGSYTCMYIIMDFEILDGSADINVAAYRNKYNQSPYCDEGTYYWDSMHKGISDTAAEVNANLFITLSDDIADDTWLPVRVFNQYNPYGYETTEWITNLNPQADPNAKNKSAESDMSAFVYNDGKKSWYYGEAVPESKRDYNWHFDTIHGDNKYPIVSKTWVGPEDTGHWEYTKSDVIPSDHIPNDVLTLSVSQSDTDITSFDLACSMGNYSVKTYYYMYVFNIGSSTRTFEYWLNTESNNMLALYLPSENMVYYGCKGEYNGKECIFSVDIEPGDYEYFVIMEVLPTGNPGGMKNFFRVSN